MISKKYGYFSKIWWFVPAALAAGVVNGLLGAGGGIIMLYLVRFILAEREERCEVQKDAFASVVAIMLPVSVVSAVSYAAKGNLDMDVMGGVTIPALAGGMLGAYLTDKLPTRIIRAVFAVLVIVSGVRMIL